MLPNEKIKNYVLITTTILAVLVVYNAYFIASESLYSFGNIVYYTAIIVGIIIALIFYLLKKQAILVFPLSFILIILPTKIIVDEGIVLQRESAMNNGNKIVLAIEQYQIKYKQLPNKLSELEPVFIGKLPHYYLGLDPNNYIYEKRDSLNYSLSFFTAGVISYTNDPTNRTWYSHD
jgi:hypothetical protein